MVVIVGKPIKDEGIEEDEGDDVGNDNDVDEDKGPKSGIMPITDVVVVGEKER